MWLSVLIATYNGEAFLPATLDSLVGEVADDVEIIAIDDVSSDGTWDILRDYARRLPMRIFRRRARRGNRGIRHVGMGARLARGEYVGYLDQDDVWLPGRVRALREATRRHPGAVVVHPAYFVDRPGRRVGLWRPRLPTGRALQGREVAPRLLVQNLFHGCAPIFPQRLAREMHASDRRFAYASDWELWLRLIARAPLVCLAEPLTEYRLHRDSTTAVRGHGCVVRTLESVITKHLAVWSTLPGIERIAAAARLSNAVNAAGLAALGGGDFRRWVDILTRAREAGLGGMLYYVRHSGIFGRLAARLRAGVSPAISLRAARR